MDYAIDVHVYVRRELYRALIERAIEEGVPLSAVVEDAVSAYFGTEARGTGAGAGANAHPSHPALVPAINTTTLYEGVHTNGNGYGTT